MNHEPVFALKRGTFEKAGDIAQEWTRSLCACFSHSLTQPHGAWEVCSHPSPCSWGTSIRSNVSLSHADARLSQESSARRRWSPARSAWVAAVVRAQASEVTRRMNTDSSRDSVPVPAPVWDQPAIDAVLSQVERLEFGEVLEALGRGFPVNAASTGQRLLLHAVVGTLHNSPPPGSMEVLTRALHLGADPNMREGRDGVSLLSTAAVHGTAPVLRVLLAAGASAGASACGTGRADITPLFSLAWSPVGDDLLERATVLLEQQDLDVDAQFRGITAAEFADAMGQADLAALIRQVRCLPHLCTHLHELQRSQDEDRVVGE